MGISLGRTAPTESKPKPRRKAKGRGKGPEAHITASLKMSQERGSIGFWIRLIDRSDYGAALKGRMVGKVRSILIRFHLPPKAVEAVCAALYRLRILDFMPKQPADFYALSGKVSPEDLASAWEALMTKVRANPHYIPEITDMLFSTSHFIEVKSSKGEDGWSLEWIKDHQIESLLEIEKAGGKAWLIIIRVYGERGVHPEAYVFDGWRIGHIDRIRKETPYKTLSWDEIKRRAKYTLDPILGPRGGFHGFDLTPLWLEGGDHV